MIEASAARAIVVASDRPRARPGRRRNDIRNLPLFALPHSGRTRSVRRPFAPWKALTLGTVTAPSERAQPAHRLPFDLRHLATSLRRLEQGGTTARTCAFGNERRHS